MSSEARSLFEELRGHILAMDGDVIELAERKSVSFHAPNFFLEVLPRRYRLSILLAMDFDEVDDPLKISHDATQWKFLVSASHEGGVLININNSSDIRSALPLIKQAHAASED
jgi:predicted transport protein